MNETAHAKSRIQTYFEKFIVLLMPTLRIKPKLLPIWRQREARGFLLSSRVIYIVVAIAYMGHFFLVDIPLKKENLLLWGAQRFSLALLGLTAFALSFSSIFRSGSYIKVPLFLFGLFCSFFQAKSMLWRAEVPYIYSIVIPAIATIALRSNMLFSVLYLLLAFAIESFAWLHVERVAELPYILSAAVVGMITVIVFRSRLAIEVTAFLNEMEKLEAQQNLITAQKEISDQIKAFLPKRIYERFSSNVLQKKQNHKQAMLDVLRCKRKFVSCLYTDIRDFTKKSKGLESYLLKSAIPNIRRCTEIVEEHEGIPRHVGDLIFSYFDHNHCLQGLVMAVACAAVLLQENEEMNKRQESANTKIKRYVLISHGEAVVGNIGANDASREVTVLGPPANILSRIDPLTKIYEFQVLLDSSAIILTQSAVKKLTTIIPSFTFVEIFLPDIGVTIRDFPEEQFLYIIPHNHAIFATLFDLVREKKWFSSSDQQEQEHINVPDPSPRSVS
ncbi:MAG: hypothetical protein HQK52_22800 [Oligoflexia bacterium]|nr:hypothetical protein [Oligoflexia bacterium]